MINFIDKLYEISFYLYLQNFFCGVSHAARVPCARVFSLARVYACIVYNFVPSFV